MIELETNSGIDNDKHNKLHKYRLYKALKGLVTEIYKSLPDINSDFCNHILK